MFPILDYDPDPQAIVNPSDIQDPVDIAPACVICFFLEVVERVARDYSARLAAEVRWEDGLHQFYEISYQGSKLAFFHPSVGGPIAAGLLEESIALGCRKFITVGGCGVLEQELEVGKLIAVSAAVRDEGVSYHYLPPGREIPAQPAVLTTIQEVLTERGLPYHIGKTWTTDAPYRETRTKIVKRRSEGCLAVEMEAASLMAVARFRGVDYGQILYAGDDLSGEEWDNRGWQTREEIRQEVFWIAADICLQL